METAEVIPKKAEKVEERNKKQTNKTENNKLVVLKITSSRSKQNVNGIGISAKNSEIIRLDEKWR